MQRLLVRNQVIGIVIIPIVLSIILVPYSLWIGWNLPTLLLFWFGLIPVLAAYLPRISKFKNHLPQSLIGLAVFYLLMIFMIYENYQSDYFLVMILSWVFNTILVTAIIEFSRKRKGIG